jgi:hypothetical protein
MTDEGRKFFGFEPGEAIDHATLAGRVHPEDRAARATAIQHALATGGSMRPSFASSCPMARCDGSPRGPQPQATAK